MSDIACYKVWRAAARALAGRLVREWGAAQWRRQVAESGSLRLYAALRPQRGFARHLDDAPARPAATRLRCKLRGNLYPLAAVIAHRQQCRRGQGPGCAVCNAPPAGLLRAEPSPAPAPEPAALAGAHCRLCGAAVEDTAHFVLTCAALAPARGDLFRDLSAACASEAMVAMFAAAAATAPRRDDLVLRLCLGADPTLPPDAVVGGDAETAFMQPRSVGRRSGTAHPACDRLAMQRVAGERLVRMARMRLAALHRDGHIPTDDSAGWQYYREYQPRGGVGVADDAGAA